ncbi:MAG TPA: hypothetical protein PK629_02685 [Oscillospiraceae bacterium]|nr:hypothetical protein [Oscillospiraceae bacterium]HPF56313.1 hypothetical protein [Clostridiales bacterium]HPK34232.1 hypothetical protein [Oscillospiraceae bacterium]HPR74865.1 hypothetical protein [Oscillospiraceae bacterium]
MNTHILLLYVSIVLELLGVLFLALFSCLKLHGKFRVFIIGLFVFLLVDAVDYIAKQISLSTGAFDSNAFGVQMIVFAIQAIILAFCAYFSVKVFVNFSYRYKDFFTIGAGAAAFKLLDGAKEHFSYLQLLLGNYTVTEGGMTAEQYQQNADALLQIPVVDFGIALFEVLLTSFIIILAAYLASSALAREEDSMIYIPIGAGVYLVYSAAYWALFRYVSIWLGLAVGLAAAVGSIFVLRSERE